MALNSASFVVFLACVCVLAYLCPRKFRYLLLLATSYGFYLYSPRGWQANLPALGLLLCATVCSWLCALGIQWAKGQRGKRLFLGLSLLVCLGLLLLCKYYNFFSGGLRAAGVPLPALELILPLGISYYTLQSVSYAADVYLGTCKAERNPFMYALYLSFFPGIVTGPINRAPEMLKQYREPPRFEYNRVAGGLFRVLWGIFKKMVVADSIGRFTSQVFAEPGSYTGPILILGALAFAYQLYADFGGCCDIAIGAAEMLGFTFTDNFKRPFAAKTFSALWQRWHISLTSFFRDYVFTPLVWSRWTEKLPVIGKRVQSPPMNSSVLIIYTLSGLWHGASMGYVLWGLVTGCIMVGAKYLAKPKDRLVKHIPVYRAKHVRGAFQRVFVYLLFAGTLVFFAASLYGGGVLPWLKGILHGWRSVFGGALPTALAALTLTPVRLVVLAAGILLVEGIEKFAVTSTGTVAGWIRRRGWWLRWPLYYLLITALLLFGIFGQSDFIYQNY